MTYTEYVAVCPYNSNAPPLHFDLSDLVGCLKAYSLPPPVSLRKRVDVFSIP